ncbi:CHASE domain-containing protein [Thalassolituus sp.]|jgi:PAS domain S-box-containing protein|uniref:CHASE domain-containing protein n=2 Tax=Thalassolituus TaxID=187492 RepID=UPI0032D8CEFE
MAIGSRRNGQLWIWMTVSFVTGLLISYWASVRVEQSNQEHIDRVLSIQAQDLIQQIYNRVELYQYGLRGLRGTVATAQNNLSRELIERYSKTRDLDLEFPGARGFGFIRRVPVADEMDFVKQATLDGWPDFSVRQLTQHGGERYIIQYIEPVGPNKAAVGLDIASEYNRREAAFLSLRTGEVRLTGPITLVQATGKPLQSFLIMLPIYKNAGTPTTVEERERLGFGWSYAPLIIEEVLTNLRLRPDYFAAEIKDVTKPEKETQFFDNRVLSKGDLVSEYQVEREVFGRTWQFKFGAYPAFGQSLNMTSKEQVFALGTVLSFLISAVLALFINNRQRRADYFAQQARLAGIVESSTDAIISQDINGKVISWNSAAERMFGISAIEAIGNSLADLIIPNDIWQKENLLYKEVTAEKQPFPSIESQRIGVDGQLIDVSISIAVVRNTEKEVIGISETIRDISIQKSTQAEIIKLNSNLERQVEERTLEVRTVNTLLESVLDSASAISIIATDINGIVILFNKGAEEMLGYKAEEMVGVQSPAIIHSPSELEQRAKELSNQYQQKIEGFKVFTFIPDNEGLERREWTYIRKDGTRLLVSLSVTVIRDIHGAISGYLGIAVDISEQNKQHEALAFAMNQLAMAANVAELGVWSWEPGSDFLEWNDRMFAMYQQPLELKKTGVMYEHWIARVHPDDKVRTEEALNAAIERRADYDLVFRIILPDGSERSIKAAADIEFDKDNNVVRITGINQDITEQIHQESILRHAKEKADEASAAKSNFLANMSHEIRTPMNAVLGMLQLVANTNLDDRQRDYISKSKSAARSLLSLLNDVLDYSKIEAGKLQLDLHPFSMDEVLRNLAVVLSGNLGSKSVEVLYDIDLTIPQLLLGDSNRLQQVLINLSGNALKFTSTGYVIVRVHKISGNKNDTCLRISVEDTGIGISKENQVHIFDGFTQAEVSTSRRYGGTGLGLVICKRLTTLMGATLNLESELGEGSKFWFDLNLPVVSASDTDDIQIVDRRVLVVEDNQLTAELFQRTGMDLGWRVDVAYSGKIALKMIAKAQEGKEFYDVVLMDLQLPDINGDDVAQSIVNLMGEDAPKIIIISAYGQASIGNEFGDDAPVYSDFLSKPITPLQLSESVERVLNTRENPVVENNGRLQRLKGKHLLVVEDNIINREIAYELLATEGANVDLATGGIEGVDKVISGTCVYDLVLMDIQMPDIDGLEATRRIRADGRWNNLPIVAMTANVSLEDREACAAVGMNAHISKPVDLEELVNTVLLVGMGTSTEDKNVSTNDSAYELIEDKLSLLRRFNNNKNLFKRMQSMFVVEMQTIIEEVALCWQTKQWHESTKALHTLKGAAGTMGAVRLSRRARDMEEKFKLIDDDNAVDVECSGLLVELVELVQLSDEALASLIDNDER